VVAHLLHGRRGGGYIVGMFVVLATLSVDFGRGRTPSPMLITASCCAGEIWPTGRVGRRMAERGPACLHRIMAGTLVALFCPSHHSTCCRLSYHRRAPIFGKVRFSWIGTWCPWTSRLDGRSCAPNYQHASRRVS
jgi:hypothetical protein